MVVVISMFFFLIFLIFAHAAIWATKQTENTTGNAELTIKTTLRELIIYVIFLIILCISEFGLAYND